MLTCLLSVCLMLIHTPASYAQQAESVYRFLYLDSHARSAALGGAHPAIPDGGYELMHVNPAFLIRATDPKPQTFRTPAADQRIESTLNPLADQETTSNRTLSPSSDQETTSNRTPAANRTAFIRSFQSTYLNHLDDIQYLSASAPIRPESLPLPASIRRQLPSMAISVRAISYGDLTGYDADGKDTGSLSAGELAVTAGVADLLHEQVHWGVSLSYIHSGLAGYRSGGVAFSGGLHILSRDRNTSFGLTILNAGTQITTYQQTREPLPLQIHAGMSKRLQYLPLRYFLTARYRPDDDLRTAGEASLSVFETIGRSMLLGAEIYFGDFVTLRLGYDYLLSKQAGTDKRVDTAGLHGGLGIRRNRFDFHLARTSLSDLGGVLQLSMTYRF